eukprot:m.224537 g.224537  ORF g.224537 m.224537 type:complete len:243 (+) comp11105_c0_seq1:1-729(+)
MLSPGTTLVVRMPSGSLWPTMASEEAAADQQELDVQGSDPDTIFFNPESFTLKHPLQRRWTFWFDNPNVYGRKSQDKWESNLIKIYTVETVEDFWAVYTNLAPAAGIAEGGNYHFFKENVKPLWEDEANKLGGKWVVVLGKGSRFDVSDLWMKTMLLIIGEQFGDFGDEIRGAVYSRRKAGDRISLWTAHADNRDACLHIGRKFKETLSIPLQFTYQTHSDALRKGNSFANQSRYSLETPAP